MKLYILYVFGDEHKMWTDSNVIGYFTNKAALGKAIKKFAVALGINSPDDFFHYFNRGDYRNAEIFMETGTIEFMNTNEILAVKF